MIFIDYLDKATQHDTTNQPNKGDRHESYTQGQDFRGYIYSPLPVRQRGRGCSSGGDCRVRCQRTQDLLHHHHQISSKNGRASVSCWPFH